MASLAEVSFRRVQRKQDRRRDKAEISMCLKEMEEAKQERIKEDLEMERAFMEDYIRYPFEDDPLDDFYLDDFLSEDDHLEDLSYDPLDSWSYHEADWG